MDTEKIFLDRSATPRVSVLTTVFNCERFVREALESVRAQTFTDWEHIGVDDAATDGTAAVLAQAAQEDPRCMSCTCRKISGRVGRCRSRSHVHAANSSPFSTPTTCANLRVCSDRSSDLLQNPASPSSEHGC